MWMLWERRFTHLILSGKGGLDTEKYAEAIEIQK